MPLYVAMPEISVLEHPIAVFMFLILALGVGGAFASEVNDFTNNLATDLGPLLTLFGEGMTKQYLSKSTTFVDYLIFRHGSYRYYYRPSVRYPCLRRSLPSRLH